MFFIRTGLEDGSDDSDSDTELNFDEEGIITYYFNRGFEYSEILLFLTCQASQPSH